MAVKKIYLEIVKLMENNLDKKVEDILPALMELASKSRADETAFYHPETGKLLAIYCYYHKRWEQVSVHEYGVKRSTKTGLNTMCKEGNRMWNKQYKDSRYREAELLVGLYDGTLKVTDIGQIRHDIETAKFTIKPSEIGVSFSELSELKKEIGL